MGLNFGGRASSVLMGSARWRLAFALLLVMLIWIAVWWASGAQA